MVQENSTTRKAINKIKLESLSFWIYIESVKVSIKITTQDEKFRFAVCLNLRWKFVGMPFKGHERIASSNTALSHCTQPFRVSSRPNCAIAHGYILRRPESFV